MIYAKAHGLFYRVVDAYVATKLLPTVAAYRIDLDSDRARRWTPDGAHFTCDVERVTEATLKDRPDLQVVWFLLAQGFPADKALSHEVVRICAGAYARKGLDPGRYFRIVRQGGTGKYRRIAG